MVWVMEGGGVGAYRHWGRITGVRSPLFTPKNPSPLTARPVPCLTSPCGIALPELLIYVLC